MKGISRNKTAILVFARTSQEEVAHKKIKKGNLLFETLNQHTLQTVKATGIPFFHFTEKLQEGDSFGARFSNAIQQVFDKGYERIITVGNDSPHLSETHITSAVIALDENRLVIGPSADGGFYLMGLLSEDFKKRDFEKLPWQTSEIAEEVLQLLSPSQKNHFLLPQLVDIDSFHDVTEISKQVVGLKRAVKEVILAIISNFQKIVFPKFFNLQANSSSIPFNKGSPYFTIS